MKEKIGIEKLIELLNEYEIEKEKSEGVNVDAYVEFKWDYNNNGLVRYDETDRWEGDNLYGDTAVAYLISKSFGFIKWLVENDKIDLDKCGFKNEGLSGNWYDSGIAFVQNYDNDTYKVSEFYSPYLQLLMLLSISDTPIEDLILYLK